MDFDTLSVLQSINFIIENFIDRREPIPLPAKAVVGTKAFKEMQKEDNQSIYRYNTTGYSHNIKTVYQSPLGPIDIEVSEEVDPDHVGVGGRTVPDIIAEQILLEGTDEEESEII